MGVDPALTWASALFKLLKPLAILQGKGPQVSLLNIIIELKKCCNHPFLFSTAEEEYRGDDKDLNAVDRLVQTSGKMVLLDKLMEKLKQDGHRCVIFGMHVG